MKKTKIARNRIITYTTTLLVKKSGLILGLAFFIFACEDPGELGLDLNPENGVFVAKYQEIPLGNSVLLYDNIISDNTTRIDTGGIITAAGRLLTGSYANQDFGEIQTTSYASLLLGSVGFSNDTANYELDSMIFKIKLDYVYGNNLLGAKKLYIHELADSLKLDTLYTTKNSTLYHEDLLGEFNFDLSALDTVWVDTLLSTRLSDELGQRFLEEASDTASTAFINNDEFRKFFNGFAFVSDVSNDMITGIVAESSYLRMHFHNSIDTTYLDFIFLDRDTIGDNVSKYYNNVSLDRSGTPIEGIPDYFTEYETDTDQSYIQASAGVLTKIDFQPYLDFIDTIDYLVINRAEIDMPVEIYSRSTIPSSSLDMYVVDQDNRFIEETDATRLYPVYRTFGRLLYEKDEDENSGKYAINPTDYIQNLTDKKTDELQFLLGQPSLWNSVLSVNQTILLKEGITLKVYYSTIQ